MLSVIILIAVMLIIIALMIVVYVATGAGNPIYKRNYGDGDDDRVHVPPDTGIGILSEFKKTNYRHLENTLSKYLKH